MSIQGYSNHKLIFSKFQKPKINHFFYKHLIFEIQINTVNNLAFL
jgi:hypothetical protein